MKKIFFSNKSISNGSLFLAMEYAIANTITDGISDSNSPSLIIFKKNI